MVNMKEIEAAFDQGDLAEEYAEFIMNSAPDADRPICNGDMLTTAMEDCYLLDEFLDYKLKIMQK